MQSKLLCGAFNVQHCLLPQPTGPTVSANLLWIHVSRKKSNAVCKVGPQGSYYAKGGTLDLSSFEKDCTGRPGCYNPNWPDGHGLVPKTSMNTVRIFPDMTFFKRTLRTDAGCCETKGYKLDKGMGEMGPVQSPLCLLASIISGVSHCIIFCGLR